MTRHALIALAALLSSCATAPQQLVESGERTVHALKLQPALAASCLARNAEVYSGWHSVTVRPLDRPDRLEVILRAMPEIAIVLAHVEPDSGSGSRATIWRRIGALDQGC